MGVSPLLAALLLSVSLSADGRNDTFSKITVKIGPEKEVAKSVLCYYGVAFSDCRDSRSSIPELFSDVRSKHAPRAPAGHTLAGGTSLHPHPMLVREVLLPHWTELHLEAQRGK